jgi:hypothetical protein
LGLLICSAQGMDQQLLATQNGLLKYWKNLNLIYFFGFDTTFDTCYHMFIAQISALGFNMFQFSWAQHLDHLAGKPHGFH